MTCTHCRDLQEEVAELRRQLAYEIARDDVARLKKALGLTGHESVIVSALVSANGRIVRTGSLADHLPEIHGHERSGDQIIAVYIVRIRAKLGRDVVETVWGQGYRASRSLIERCAVEKTAAAA